MSSYFDDASLVMIPSGYKTSKVYSVKPTDGSGDLTFSRSNDTATRVNSAGLIEKVRTNLILQSNTFSNAAWIKLGAGTGTAPVLTANYTTDPFGGNNAWRFQCNLNGGTTSSDRSWIYQTFAGSPSNGTLSVYVKLNSAGSVNLVFSDGGGTTQTITSTTWVRLNTPSTTTGEFRLGLIGYNGTNTCDLSIAFAQVEYGDVATEYIATTSAAVSVGPVANVPRLDYLNSSCPRLLLEPQRTNLRTSSEQFSSLSPSNVTVTSNDTTSPDGYTNADKLTPSGSGFHTIGNSISVTAGQKYTISVFYKYGTHKNIGFYDNNTAGSEITINMETNAFTLGGSVEAGGVIPYGNGWYRAYATFTTGSSDMVNYIIFRDNTNNGNYTADGSYSWFYGWQVELGAYATSYIPTLGSASTRGSDACSKTGISSLIGQTEGVLYIECDIKAVSELSRLLFVSDGTLNNFINIYIDSDNKIYATTRLSASTVSLFASSTLTAGTYKIAYAYKANDFILYINGTAVSGSSSANIPATSRLDIGSRLTSSSYFNSFVNQAILFPTRLSNSDLAALTA